MEHYIYCFDSYCISLLFETLGAYFLIEKKRIFSIFFIVCSLSLYQAYISMTVSLIVIYFLSEILRNISVVVFGILIFTLLLSDNAEFMARQDVHNNFYYNTSVALNKAVLLDDYDDNMKWMFNSIYSYRSSLNNMSLGFVSSQNESYDNFRGLDGIRIFYERYFGKKIVLVDYDEYMKILSTREYESMNVGSVKIIDNVVVVKTSENSY